ARPVDGEAALPEGDPAGASALAARDRARARGVPRAGAHGAVLVDGDADRRLPAARGQEELDLDRQLDVAATLNTGAAPAPPAAEVEERAEQVADPAEVAEIVDGEAEAARAARGAAWPRAERREGAHATHAIVLRPLLGIGQYGVRLAHLLEAFGRRGVVRVRVRVVLLREAAVR